MSDYGFVVLENIVTLLATAAIVLGLYAMGAGSAAMWGFLVLFNLNTKVTFKKTESDKK